MDKSQLMVSISGIRGVVGSALTPEIIVKYVRSFVKLIGPGTIVIGRDSRNTGEQIKEIAISTMIMAGMDVIDVGMATTPTIALAIEYYGAQGGIAVTASHNPQEWNALKFFNKDTLFLDQEESQKLQSLLDTSDDVYKSFAQQGKLTRDYKAACKYHLTKIFDMTYIDKAAIRKKNYRVVVDCVNGAGSNILPELLRNLGCTVTEINCNPELDFPHGAEPLPENLTEICDVVKDGHYDLGMVVDPDADRLALISDQGTPLGEEYTLAIVVDLILSHIRTDVTVNISTSRVIDDVAAQYGCRVNRTKVGEIHVSKAMLKNGNIIGGEGNGGVILPDVHPGRDSLVGAALVLQYMLEKDNFIYELKNELPQYTIIKDKVDLKSIDYEKILKKILVGVDPKKIDRLDGIKINYEHHWIHMRKSNTEPCARIFIEAKTQELGLQLMQEFKENFK